MSRALRLGPAIVFALVACNATSKVPEAPPQRAPAAEEEDAGAIAVHQEPDAASEQHADARDPSAASADDAGGTIDAAPIPDAGGAPLDPCEVPASCDAATELARIFEAIDGSTSISDALQRLAFPAGLCVGADSSPSLQSSTDAADPRIFLRRGCAIVTVTPRSPSIEVAIQRQHASVGLPISPLPQDATGNLNPDEGELLADFRSFGARATWSPSESLNRFSAASDRYDSHRCTGCHVDVTITKASYGLLPDLAIAIAGTSTTVSGIVVSPYEVSPTPTDIANADLYCVAGPTSDLRSIRDCECTPHVAGASCGAFVGARGLSAEGCARIDAVLALSPVQDPRFRPTTCMNGTMPVAR